MMSLLLVVVSSIIVMHNVFYITFLCGSCVFHNISVIPPKNPFIPVKDPGVRTAKSIYISCDIISFSTLSSFRKVTEKLLKQNNNGRPIHFLFPSLKSLKMCLQFCRKQLSSYRHWPKSSTSLQQVLRCSGLQDNLQPSQVRMRTGTSYVKAFLYLTRDLSTLRAYSRSSTSGVCVPSFVSVHGQASLKHAGRWAPDRDEHSGKETHQDVAQRDTGCYEPRWCVTTNFLLLFFISFCWS